MKLKKIISFDGTVECVTGIAIKGAGNDMGIGGADSEVIKNPLTNEPYLPGSSLKGKMRSQLEHKEDPEGQGYQSGVLCCLGGSALRLRQKGLPDLYRVRGAFQHHGGILAHPHYRSGLHHDRGFSEANPGPSL